MSTGFTPEEDAILAKWLCAGCYGRYFLSGFFHGITDYNYMDITRVTTITHKGITLLSRTHDKHIKYNDEWFDPHGIIFDGPVDTNYASYWGDIAGNCWGITKQKEWDGEYSSSIQYTNTQIYFADLREDIIVYYTESGGQSCSGKSNKPMGQQLGYAFWNNSEKAACQTVNIQDAIKVPVSISPSKAKKELITLGGYTAYTASESSSRQLNVAVSEPYSSVFTMDVVDQSKPYDCKEGVFVNLVEPETLWSYRNSWDGFGTYPSIDEYDESTWNANFNGLGVNHLKDGTYDYPSFINIDSMPRGSWAVDAAGNYFHSMITRDMKTFNKLNTTDPNTAAELTGGGIVYYPIAPA